MALIGWMILSSHDSLVFALQSARVNVLSTIVTILWTLIMTYWLVSALKKKKGRDHSREGSLIRAALVIGTLLLLHHFHALFRTMSWGFLTPHPSLRIVGVFMCAVGIAFAIWARHTLGRNWGAPMSLQEGHELVTSGPYRLARHPIYTGVLFAMLGSALAQNSGWLIPFIVSSVYFIYGARVEERLMLHEFPGQYPAYKARTKMLVPFLW